ncbi:TetR family transcriptional regulator [Lichenicoccus sp.]|uniref:TetR family transcriptional regulator n=1 Tax=Lichenicoccus sp. TaxID=2781899 RepID=UPI003D0F130D
MTDEQFDTALIRAAMAQAELHGWRRVSVAEAAREAGLPLDRARVRYPSAGCMLLRLGVLADQAALIDDGSEGTARERLFDMLMRRFDVLQQYREGVRAVLRAAPLDLGLAVLLVAATRSSMAWMAQAAGLETQGLAGALRVGGLVGIWLQAVRAWERDESPDLAGTMAALDRSFDRAGWAARMLGETSATPTSGIQTSGDDAPFSPPGPVTEPPPV